MSDALKRRLGQGTAWSNRGGGLGAALLLAATLATTCLRAAPKAGPDADSNPFLAIGLASGVGIYLVALASTVLVLALAWVRREAGQGGGVAMQLFVEPDHGIFPILNAIHEARRTIDIHIFRLAYKDVEKALAAAVRRGVVVRTLIAHTSARGEKALRRLEQRLLEIGATVSRTADDLVRYHGKILIVDGGWLFVLAFNLTHRDIDRSRTLGVATRKRKLVQEAIRLFEADFDRKPYSGGAKDFLVSPVNARERLAAFLAGARKQLLIYDEGVTDKSMIRILQNRAKAGVDLRIIGKVEKGHDLTAEKYPGKRQHLRCIVRDGRAAFVGSQSLRTIELDARREIGVIVKDPKVVRDIAQTFESDWAETDAGRKQAKEREKEARRQEAGGTGGEKGQSAAAGA